ncbi:hypothetical protein DLAC_07536 [Tieghemostelium lacteum]|uniref:MACPF domain-containing protein n=1 Tax=Tieghemostelium lacteum TaxID=361077 RepID=A0A151ZCU1_TIELA|nr:hypothetical protein DLAC_07536 [Tieghemostelium lacteum]|eukprot:KYQ91749.1 hypothetical protein DLAC_07536 [Tieghemostelium lacteum]
MKLISKSFLFVADGILESYSKDQSIKTDQLSELNSFVDDGCVGELLVKLDEKHNEFNQLLGFDPDIKLTNNLFKEKYNGLKVQFLSNFKVNEIDDGSGFSHYQIKNDTEIVDRVLELSVNSDLLIILYKSGNDVLSVLEVMNNFIRDLKSRKPQDFEKYYVNLLLNFGTHYTYELSPNTNQQFNSKLLEQSQFTLPLQSYTLLDGKRLDDSLIRKTSPWIAIYDHNILSRKDNVTSFTFENLTTSQGSNGRILLIHYIKEIIFKLGKLPKYGA